MHELLLKTTQELGEERREHIAMLREFHRSASPSGEAGNDDEAAARLSEITNAFYMRTGRYPRSLNQLNLPVSLKASESMLGVVKTKLKRSRTSSAPSRQKSD